MYLQNSNELLHQERGRLDSAEKQLEQIRSELEMKDHELNEINKVYADLVKGKHPFAVVSIKVVLNL